MDKIFQTVIACNSLYGLCALALTCITIVVMLIVVSLVTKTIALKIIETYNYFHAKLSGKSIQSEIDLRSKAA